jgi:hypothetical protein
MLTRQDVLVKRDGSIRIKATNETIGTIRRADHSIILGGKPGYITDPQTIPPELMTDQRPYKNDAIDALIERWNRVGTSERTPEEIERENDVRRSQYEAKVRRLEAELEQAPGPRCSADRELPNSS